MLYKVYAVISVAFAARCAEVFELPFAAVERLTNANNEVTYKVCYKRKKAIGYVYDASTYTLIVGEMEVGILDEYFALFTAEDKQAEPRLFRKLKTTTNGNIASTKCKIGQHKAENIGKEIAKLLNLNNHAEYTGHCWRRTSATLMAEAGLVSNL